MKKIFSAMCLFSVILLTMSFLSCENTYQDYEFEGMEFYYNYYDMVPEDTAPNFSLEDEKLLNDYEYQNATFNYYAKNVGSNQLSPGDYSLNILVLEYDESVYEQVKEYLFEQEDYSTDSPKFNYNGHDFFEVVSGWSDSKSLIYHVFNDNEKRIIIMVHDGIRISDWLYTYEEKDTPIEFFKKYYGEYYDFDADTNNLVEDNQ